jgi:hypothetical protein
MHAQKTKGGNDSKNLPTLHRRSSLRHPLCRSESQSETKQEVINRGNNMSTSYSTKCETMLLCDHKKVKEIDKELFLHSTTRVCCPVHNALVSTNVTHAVATNATFQTKNQCP